MNEIPDAVKKARAEGSPEDEAAYVESKLPTSRTNEGQCSIAKYEAELIDHGPTERKLHKEIERLKSEKKGDAYAISMLGQENDRLTAENARLKNALAESCDENRAHVLAEGPWSTDMCPIAGKLSAEVTKVEAQRQSLWCALVDAYKDSGMGLGEAQIHADLVMDGADSGRQEPDLQQHAADQTGQMMDRETKLELLKIQENILLLKVDVLRWSSVVVIACGNDTAIRALGFIGLVLTIAFDWWASKTKKESQS